MRDEALTYVGVVLEDRGGPHLAVALLHRLMQGKGLGLASDQEHHLARVKDGAHAHSQRLLCWDGEGRGGEMSD